MTTATPWMPLPAAPLAARAAVQLPPLAPTAVLLAEGGDERITLNGSQPSNRYGCGPLPDPGLHAFGSCTASTISTSGFAAADALRRRLAAAAAREPAAVTYAAEMERLRRALSGACGADTVPGTELLIAASGTDLHLLAAALISGAAARPLHIIAPAAAETGRGVDAALQGRHYGSRCPAGRTVPLQARITDLPVTLVQNLVLRGGDGGARPAAVLDAEAERMAAAAVADGRDVLLIVTDVSKTGLMAPTADCASELQRRFAGRVTVMVDACQFRLAPATVAAYLRRGFIVAVTGSKFLGGPSFCGALLIPPDAASALRGAPLPATLAAYSARAEWPRQWRAAQALPERANYGLLLRWEAALTELQALCRLPDAAVAGFLAGFAAAVQGHLRDHPRLSGLAVAPLHRGIATDAAWDAIPTIFPFLLHRRGGGLLDHAAAARVQRKLAHRGTAGRRFQLGQPVTVRCGDGQAGALRLCAGARSVIDALAGGKTAARQVTAMALAALDAAAALAGET